MYDDELDEPEFDETGMTQFEIEYKKRIRLFKKVFGFEMENVPVNAKYSITSEPLSVAFKIARRFDKNRPK